MIEVTHGELTKLKDLVASIRKHSEMYRGAHVRFVESAGRSIEIEADAEATMLAVTLFLYDGQRGRYIAKQRATVALDQWQTCFELRAVD